MWKTKSLDWLALLASVVLIVVFLSFGIQDTIAIYDGALVLMTFSVIIGTMVLIRRRGDIRVPQQGAMLEIQSVGIVLAGCTVLLLVAIRQGIQVSRVEFVEAASLLNGSARERYAFVANYCYIWGWLLVLWAVRPQVRISLWWHTHQREVMPVLGLIAFALIMRLLWLEDYPNIINGDEGLIGWWARTMFSEAGPLEYTLTAMDGVGTFYLSLPVDSLLSLAVTRGCFGSCLHWQGVHQSGQSMCLH